MIVPHLIQTSLKRLQRLPTLTKVIIGVVLFIATSYSLIFGLPKAVNFSYVGDTCVRQFVLFPSVTKQTSDSGFMVTFKDTVGASGHPVASFTTCFSAYRSPLKGNASVTISPFSSWLFTKHFSLKITDPPLANTADFVARTLPVTRPVEIGLTQPDDVFDYKLQLGDKLADCSHNASKLFCDIESLGLAQGQDYQATLLKYFKDQKVQDLGGGQITTLRALALVNASVTEGQTVYDKPASFTFDYDKPLDKVVAGLKVHNGDALESVEVTTSFKDKQAIVTPKAELKRNAQYDLTLKQVEAIDGSALAQPYVTQFNLSGGPKVTGINVGRTGVNTSGSIILTFDQEIANDKEISKLAILQGITGSISKSGNRLIINYTAAKCANFSILIKKGFESAAGVAQQEDWSFAGRTLCYSVQTIGYSRQGRAINAFVFGGGGKTVLFTGAIHGNELSTRSLMNLWVDELDLNAQNIPADTRVVVIPSVNPDGVAANSRYNAAGVDLNRNYNTSDWQQDVQTVSGAPLPGGGGTSPGSEPETQALMAYTSGLQPALTMSFHSSASYAIANTCGNSSALADTYARMTGYRNMTGVGGAFDYQITGTYDDWICERLGRASVLIELSSSVSSEFSRNKAALWTMVRS